MGEQRFASDDAKNATGPGRPAVTGAPAEGLVIAKRYELGALIGEGGMARVWRAKDLTLERQVAVKFLFLREDRDRRTMLDRFLREARIAAAVRHPNVVDLLDFGTTDEGRPFMVMELLEGEALEQRLSRQPTLTLEELVRIAASVLDGLASVHRAGIVHRDLKPDNIFLLDEDGEVRPKLLDFGVSRDTDATSGRRSALTTSDGHLVGTPEYMSPEQARGLKDIDWRTDVYSMGVVLYEAFTGRLPYSCEAVGDLIIDIVGGGAPEVVSLRPEVGSALSAVVGRAMSPGREERFQSAREMRDALLVAADESLGLDVRASLPMIVPARSVTSSGPRPARGRAQSDPLGGTLDGIELPWGAEAVPSLEPAKDGGERKKWSVETALPRGPERARWPWVLAALCIPLAGFVTWLTLRAPLEPDVPAVPRVARAERPGAPAKVQVSSAPRVEPAPAEAPEPAPDAAPAAAQVRIALEGLPADARVRVDDQWVEPEGGAVQVPRDGAARRLYIVTRSGLVWRATHRADADGTYQVRVRRPRRGPREAPGTPGVIRDIDY